LNLDEVWLLPVPLSTLKEHEDVAPFAERLALCELLAAPYPWLHAKPLEKEVGTNETLDTVMYVRAHFPADDLTWLMGADSFTGVHHWGVSACFMSYIKAAVFGRTEAENKAARASITAQNMQQHTQEDFKNTQKPIQNGWGFYDIPPHPGRASDIRGCLEAEEKPEYLSCEVWQALKKSHFYGVS